MVWNSRQRKYPLQPSTNEFWRQNTFTSKVWTKVKKKLDFRGGGGATGGWGGATAVYLFRHVFVAFPIQISFFSFALIWSENVRIKELGPKADWGQNGWNFLDPVPTCDGILYFRARAAARAGKADWGDTLLAHVIWRISACIPKTGFRFQLMDEVKMYFGLWLLDDRGNLQFLLYNFGVQIIPLNWRNWKKKSKEKKREQIVFTKPVTRWCK